MMTDYKVLMPYLISCQSCDRINCHMQTRYKRQFVDSDLYSADLCITLIKLHCTQTEPT